VRVLTAALPDGDLERLGEACDTNRMPLETVASGEPVLLAPDLLAVFSVAGGVAPVDPRAVRRHGAYPVQVQGSVVPAEVLSAVRAGYSFVLVTPLRVARLTALLAYLRDVAAPPGARILTLAEDGTLSTPSGTAHLDAAEQAALRLLGANVGRIVTRGQLHDGTGADPLQVTTALRRHLESVGSGAQILKVPHMGFRFVGTVITNDGDDLVEEPRDDAGG
jgi:hypothetical protein